MTQARRIIILMPMSRIDGFDFGNLFRATERMDEAQMKNYLAEWCRKAA